MPLSKPAKVALASILVMMSVMLAIATWRDAPGPEALVSCPAETQPAAVGSPSPPTSTASATPQVSVAPSPTAPPVMPSPTPAPTPVRAELEVLQRRMGPRPSSAIPCRGAMRSR